MPSIVCSGERQVLGPSSRFHLSLDELDEFMRHLEETAYSAQNLQVHDRLGQLLTRLDSGLSGDVDEGAHIVAAGRGAPRLHAPPYPLPLLPLLLPHNPPPP